MTMTASLTMPVNPIVGQPMNFVLNIANSSGSNVNLLSVQPIITLGNGQPFPGCNIGPILIPPSQAVAVTSGSQNQVVVPAGSSINLAFSAVIYGPVVMTGAASQGTDEFLVTANINTSDNAVFAPVAQELALSSPQFGVSPGPGAPPNVNPIGIGELQFNLGTNAVFLL